MPRTEQKQITEFMRRGYFERHLNRMRMIYKGKRDYILKALEPYMNRIRIYGENSGLHLLIRFLDGRSEAELVQRAKAFNIHIFGLSQYTITPDLPENMTSTIILGYGSLTQKALKEGMDRLIQCLFE